MGGEKRFSIPQETGFNYYITRNVAPEEIPAFFLYPVRDKRRIPVEIKIERQDKTEVLTHD